MKKAFFFAAVLFALMYGGARGLFAQQNTGAAAILNHHAARNFTAGNVSAADIDLIVQAGLRAPSAMNRQPWHFTVIQNQGLAKKIISNVADGNVLIVVSARGGGTGGHGQVLDCALAVQSMYLAAQALGYGSRIYTGPVNALNGSLKQDVGLSVDQNAVALVRVGKAESADTVSAASTRKKAEDVVTYKR